MKIKKKHVFIGIPVIFVLLLASFVFFYGMSRNFTAPEDTVDGVGLSDVLSKPLSGTPADYTPAQNAAIALGVLHEIGSYNTEMNGDINANIGFMTYVQNMKDIKIVDQGEVYQESVSVSSMASVAQQKYLQLNNQIYLVRSAENITGQNVTWSDEITPISQETYVNTYGLVPNGLSPYVVSKSTILSAEVVQQSDDKYIYTYQLDPETAPAYYRRQVKALSGSEKVPLFHSVELTIEIDRDWRPIQITMRENYDISIPVVGSANCTTEYVEVFKDYGQPQNIPDREVYTTYIRDKYDPTKLGTLSSSSDSDMTAYLGKVFGANENGVFALQADVTLNGMKAPVYIEGNLKENTYRILFGNVFAAMQGEKLYLSYGDLKYYLTVDGLLDALEKAGEAAGFVVPDFGGDMMNDFMGNMTVAQRDGVQEMVLRDDWLDLTVHLSSNTMQLIDTELAVDTGSVQLYAYVMPAVVGTKTFPHVDASYESILPLLSYVNPIIYLVNADSWELQTRFTLTGEPQFNQTAYIKLVRTAKGVNMQADADILGQHLTVRLINGMIYANYGNLKVSFDTNNLEEASQQLQKLIPIAGRTFSLTDLLPQAYLDLFTTPDIESLLRTMRPISVQGDLVTLRFAIGEDTVTIAARKKGDILNGLSFDGVKISNAALQADGTLTALNTSRTVITAPGTGYVRAESLLAYVEPVENLLAANTLELTAMLQLRGAMNFYQPVQVVLAKTENGYDVALSATVLGVPIEIKLIDSVAYVDIGDLKVKLHTFDFRETIEQIGKLFPQNSGFSALSELIAQEYVDLITDFTPERLVQSLQGLQAGSNSRKLMLAVGKSGLRLELERSDNAISRAGVYGLRIGDHMLGIEAAVKAFSAQKTVVAVEHAENYTDLLQIAQLAEPVKNTLEATSYVMDLNLQTQNGQENVAQDARLTIVRRGDTADFALTAQVQGVPLNVTLLNGIAYVQCGEIKVSADQYLLEALLDQIAPNAIPKDLATWLATTDLQSILNSVSYLSTEETAIHAGVRFGKQTADIALQHNETFLTGAKITGLELGGNALNISVRAMQITPEVLPITVVAEEYISADEVLPTIQAIYQTATASSYRFDAKLALQGDIDWIQDIKIRLTREENGLSCKVETMLAGELLRITYTGDTAYVSYGNANLCVAMKDLDTITDMVKGLLPEDAAAFEMAWSAILPQAYLEDYERLHIAELIQAFSDGNVTLRSVQDLCVLAGQITQFTADSSGAKAEVRFGEAPITLAVTREYEMISAVQLQGVTALDSSVELNLQSAAATRDQLAVRLPEDQFVDGVDLAAFAKPLKNLLKANSYAFDVEAALTGDHAFMQTAHVRLARGETGVQAELTAELYGKMLELIDIQDTIYVRYGNVLLKAARENFDELQTAVEALLPQDSGGLNWDALLPQAYLDYFNSPWTTVKVIDAITELSAQDDMLTAKLKLGDDVLTVTAMHNGSDLTDVQLEGATLLEGKANLKAHLTQIGEVTLPSVDDAAYLDSHLLIPVLQAVKQATDVVSYEFDVHMTLTGTQNIDETAHITLVRTEQGMRAQATMLLEGETLLMQYDGKIVYLQYGALQLKLEQNDFDAISDTVQALLPQDDVFELARILPQVYLDWYENLALAQFIEDMQAGKLNQQTLEPAFILIQSIAELTASDTGLTVKMNVGGELIPLHITYGEMGLASANMQNLTALDSKGEITATVTSMEKTEVPLSTIDTAAFADAKQVAELLPVVQRTINQERYRLNTTLYFGAYTMPANVTLLKNGAGIDGELTAELDGEQLYVQHMDGTTYLRYSNLNLMLADTDIEKMVHEVQAVLPENAPGFDWSTVLPQEYLDELKHLGVAELIGNLQAGRVTRETLAPAFRLVQKLQLQTELETVSVKTSLGNDEIILRTSGDQLLRTAHITGLTVLGHRTDLETELIATNEAVDDLTKTQGTYTDLAQAIGFVQPAVRLLTADTITLTASGVGTDALNGNLDANIRLKRTKTGIDGILETTLVGHPLTITLIDGVTYVDYREMKLKLRLNDIGEITDEICAVLPQDGDLDFSRLLPQTYVDFIRDFTAFQLLQKLDHLTLNNTSLGLALKLSEHDVIQLKLERDDMQMLSTQISGMQLMESNITVNTAVTALNEPVELPEKGYYYSDLRLASKFAKPLAQVLQADHFQFETQIQLNGSIYLEEKAQVQLALRKDKNGAVNGVDVYATAEIDGRTLEITALEHMVHLKYGDIRLKLNLDELDTIMDRLRAILPEGVIGERTDMLAMLPQTYQKLINSFTGENIDFEHILNTLSIISVDEDWFIVVLDVEGEELKAYIERDGDVLTGFGAQGINLSGQRLAGFVRDLDLTQEAAIAPVADSQTYLNIADLLDHVQAGMNSYQQLNTRIFDTKVDLNINRHEMKGAIVDNRAYLYYHDGTQFKVGGKPYTGIKLQMDYSSVLDLAVTGVDLLEIDLPEDVKQHILGDRQPLDTSVLDALPIPSLEDLLQDNNVNTYLNVIALFENIQLQGDTLTVKLNSRELFGDKTMPSTVLTVTKGQEGDREIITAVTIENTASQDMAIVKPQDANNYMDLSSLNTFADSLIKTADLGEYRIEGTLMAYMNIIGIPFRADIPTDFRLNLNENHTVQSAYMQLTVPYFFAVLQHDMITKVYYQEGILYFDRCWEVTSGMWWWTQKHDYHEYMKCTLEEFMADPMKYVFFCVNFTSLVENAIRDAINQSDQKAVRTGSVVFEELLRNYEYNGDNQWNVNLHAAHLFNNSDFSNSLAVKLVRGNNGIFNQIGLSTRALNLIDLSMNNGKLLNADGSKVDMSVVPEDLSSDSRYKFGEVTSEIISK